MKQIYLDYAAATPLDPRVLKAMEPYLSNEFYNPSSIYLAARRVRKAFENARSNVAGCLGVRPAEVVFTAGATEANNLAIRGVMEQYPKGEILISAIEHDSVIEPAKLFNHRMIPVTKDGIVDLDQLNKMIGPKTAMVSIGLVNNEIGTLQPLREISKMLEQSSILLHCDAAQAPNILDAHISRLGVDLMSLNGGKIYGPKQSGVLYVKAGVHLKPLILGGGQEFGLRSGTENVAAAVGLAKALVISQSMRRQESVRLAVLRQRFIHRLKGAVPEMFINGPVRNSAQHILSVSFPGADNERLMMLLDEAGVQAAVGSACSASNQEPSHVLRSIGLSDEQANSTLRFSFGRQTKIEDIDKTISFLRSLMGSEQ